MHQALAKQRASNPETIGAGNPKQSKASRIAVELLSGACLEEIVNLDPGYFLQNKRKIEEFHAYSTVRRTNESLKTWPSPLVYQGLDPSTSQVIEWLKSNIKQRRPFRATQLFISGPTRHFKTTMVEFLKLYLRVYDIPKGEDFYDLWENSSYDLAMMDEFKGNKTIQWMNEFLQGSVMNLRQKGKQTLKTMNIPVIILANYPLHQLYRKIAENDPTKFETLSSRLLQINLERPLDILGLAVALDCVNCQAMKDCLPHLPLPVSQITSSMQLNIQENDNDRGDINVPTNIVVNNIVVYVILKLLAKLVVVGSIAIIYFFNNIFF